MSIIEQRVGNSKKLNTKYLEYLQSDHWVDLRKRYAKSHDQVCVVCGATENLHLHHKTYKRLGKERFKDLVYLCSQCHSEVHGKIQARSEKEIAILKSLRVKKSHKRKRRSKKIKKRYKTQYKKPYKKKHKKKKYGVGVFRVFR